MKTRIILLSVMVSLLIFAGAAYLGLVEKQQAEATFWQEVRDLQERITTDLAPALWLHQHGQVRQIIRPLQNQPGVAFYRLVDSEQERQLGFRDSAFEGLIGQFLQNHQTTQSNDRYFLTRLDLQYNDEPVGAIICAYERFVLDNLIFTRWKKLAIVAGLALLLVWMMSWQIIRKVNRPEPSALISVADLPEDLSLPELTERLKRESGLEKIAGYLERLAEELSTTAPDGQKDSQLQSDIFDTHPLPMLIINTDGDVCQANPAAGKFWEAEPDQLNGDHIENLLQILPYEYRHPNVDSTDRGEQQQIAFRYAFSKDHRSKPVDFTVTPLNSETDVPQLLITCIDIANMVERQEKIIHQQKQLESVNKLLYQKARSLKQEEQKNRRYAQKLMQFIKLEMRTLRSNSRQELLDALLHEGCKLIEAQGGILYTWQEEQKRFQPLQSSFIQEHLCLTSIDWGNNLLSRVLQTRKALFVNEDVSREWEVLGFDKGRERPLLAVPVAEQNYIFGVALYYRKEGELYTEEDCHLLSTFARHSAAQLENIETVQKLKKRSFTLQKRQSGLEKAHKQLFQLQKMESLEILVGGIAHDFNNILGIINPNIDLLRMRYGKDPEIGKRLTIIRKASERAAHLTRQLMMFSRSDDVNLQPISPNELIERLANMLPRALGSKIEIRTQLDPDIPKIQGDDTKLFQVLINLAMNARDAMPHGGVLSFSTAFEEVRSGAISTVKGGKYVRISVSDTGVGIPDDQLYKIFDPFFTTKGVQKGTGLGLSVAYGIVKSHNGYIAVESKLKEGTSFHLYLIPVLSGALPEVPAGGRLTAQAGTENILVVDDEEMIRESLSDLLKHLGYNVYLAEGGPQALQIVKNTNDIHLAIVDFAMPKMNGLETIQAIREIAPEMKVVLSSGYTEQEGWSREEQGIAAFLRKPYDIENLSTLIKKVLGNKAAS